MKIKNLAFKGGAVLGIAYTGALQVFEENNILSDIENVAGTSAGAITAIFISLGYTSKECQNIIFEKDFSDFKDHHKLGEFAKKYGWHDGDNFTEWIEKYIKQKLGKAHATFRDLKRKVENKEENFRSLSMFATDLNEQRVKVFSSLSEDENILNIPIAEAARASMSIPFFFDAWKFSENIHNDHLFVDGGVMYNYPLTFFDAETTDTNNENFLTANYYFNKDTLGMYLTNLSDTPKVSDLDYDFEFAKYSKDLVNSLLNSQYNDLMKHPDDVERTIFIDTLGISPVDFEITDNEKCELINSGIDACTKKLKELRIIPQTYEPPKPHTKFCKEKPNIIS